MDCDVCVRPFNGRRTPICPSCAQVTLYQSRILQVTSLLDTEKSHSQAEAIIRPGNDGVLAALPADIDFDAITTGMKKHGLERYHAERRIIEDRVEAIAGQAEQLRKQVEEYRSYTANRKLEHNRRRKALVTEETELARLKPRMLEPVNAATRKAWHRLDKVTDKIVDSRALLCREAALACGLQRRRTHKDRWEYMIGGNVIPDLKELGLRSRRSTTVTTAATTTTSSARTLAEPHALITASLDDVARLLSIAAHYLSVRLPAEIVLPHADFPRCVILPERASYKPIEPRYPGAGTGTSSRAGSPATSRLLLDPSLPRPRPLSLDHPLAYLGKEDPKAYGLFVEGVALLAWDLAWLCRTQGIDSVNSFDDFSQLGRNLWQLLAAAAPPVSGSSPPSLDRRISTASDREADGGEGTRRTARLGLLSHASGRHGLTGRAGAERLREWKLASPARVTDKLKTFLLTEIQGAEWDLLEEQEWEQERDDEQPVLVGGSGRPHDSRHPAMSVMTVASREDHPPDRDVAAAAAAADDRKKGSHGWMKIRGRNEDI